MKYRIFNLVLAAVCAMAPLLYLAAGEREITAKNWNVHPRILEVRSIFNAIEALIAKKQMTKCGVHVEQNGAGLDVTCTSFCDSTGTVRRLTVDGGTEDSAMQTSHYYDEKGKLRFVFVKGGAVNGAQLEQRIYFDAGGNRIWEIQRYLGKQRYTFPEKWPDELIVHDPATRFTEQ